MSYFHGRYIYTYSPAICQISVNDTHTHTYKYIYTHTNPIYMYGYTSACIKTYVKKHVQGGYEDFSKNCHASSVKSKNIFDHGSVERVETTVQINRR